MKRQLVPATLAYRLRLIVGFSAVIALVAGAWAWSLTAPVTDAVIAQQEERLTDLARAGVALVATADVPLQEFAEGLAGTGNVRTTIIAADGSVLADSDEDPATLENHGDRPEVREALAGRTGTDIRRSDTQGVERMYVAMPATYRGERIVIRTSESLARIAELSSSMRGTGTLLLVAVLVLAAGMVWQVTRAAARPVERLAEAAHAMAAGDLDSAVLPGGAGALAPLSQALGDLREQLRGRLEALETEERTLRLALDGLSDAVLLLDDSVVRLANQSLRTMFRVPPGDLRGRSLESLGLPAPVEAAIAGSLGSNDTVALDLGPDPYRRYHRVVVLPLGVSDATRRTLAVVSDVTDRMRLDAVRRDFVANASHELKTPTAGILLLAEAAESAAADGDTAQALSFVGQIATEAARLKKLVADLLDLSRIESVPNDEEIADVRHAVELGLAGHRRAAAAKGLGLSADLDAVAGADVAVRCGTTDIAVALDNLLSNAITYTETGSVSVGVEADDDTVTLRVSDTGIGIPAEDVERVFERFYRVDRGRSRTSGGTGLGLSLVRNIAERAGGAVSIVSTQGSGTTVSLTLPRAR